MCILAAMVLRLMPAASARLHVAVSSALGIAWLAISWSCRMRQLIYKF